MSRAMDPYTVALRRFHRLWRVVRRSRLSEPTAIILATADVRGRPSVRTVLLKKADARGFVFYTNAASRKGQQLARNPRAALCCYWEPVDSQVLIEGSVEQVSDEEADSYWAHRPRLSQLGAWASHQSRRLSDRRTLIQRLAQYRKRFAGRLIPRPPYWRGYRVVPDRIEFWKRRPFRLHERTLYLKRRNRWAIYLLYP